MRLQLGFLCSMWVITPLLFTFFFFFRIFIFPFGYFSWLEGAKDVKANLAGLAFFSLLLGTVHALWPHLQGKKSLVSQPSS